MNSSALEGGRGQLGFVACVLASRGSRSSTKALFHLVNCINVTSL